MFNVFALWHTQMAHFPLPTFFSTFDGKTTGHYLRNFRTINVLFLLTINVGILTALGLFDFMLQSFKL
jgi:hypothetical protein